MNKVKEFPYGKERFFAKSRRKPIKYIETENGCWECVSHCRNKDYPYIVFEGKAIGGNQLAFILVNGSIPEGLVVRHKCDNPPCINPEHLELGTQFDNIQDTVERGRNYIPTPDEVRGENNGHAILTEQEVREIKIKMMKPYKGYRKDLAKEYNVSEATIKSIRSKKNWGWLEVGIHGK